MSSRFIKKVEKIYSKAKEKGDVVNEELNEEKSEFKTYNKFSLFLNESSSDSNPELCDKAISILTKSKSKKSRRKKNLPKADECFKDLNEDELIETFSSMNEPFVEWNKKPHQTADALTLKYRNLNEYFELQQMFGPEAVPATAHQALPGNNRGRSNQTTLLRFSFGKRDPMWPGISANRLGLTMEIIDNENGANDDGECKWCVVKCSDEYLQGERDLKTTMRVGNFQDHLKAWPYHINSLLQLSMLLVNQEDFTMAADLWKRIFYVYETITPMGVSILRSSSAGSLSKSHCSLDYRYRLNRGLFVALIQWIFYLCQKSCFNTALEYCKVLLGLNVKHDPMGVVLLIDDIALRCDQYDYLLLFYNQFKESKSLRYLPNFSFSIPLCYFLKSIKSKNDTDLSTADNLLVESIIRFPCFLVKFIEACQIKVDDNVWNSSLFSTYEEHVSLTLLIDLYLKRSANLWKNAAVLRWMEKNVQHATIVFNQSYDSWKTECGQVKKIYQRETPLAIKRHIVVSGYGELLGADVTTTNERYLFFDPLAPANSEGGYDHYFNNDIEDQLDESWLINLIRSFWPSFR